MAKSPKFERLLKQMAELHERKNNDYASDSNPFSNFESAAAFAGVSVETVFEVLIGIKRARLEELTASGKVPNNESIQDTRMDLVMYEALRTAYFSEETLPPVYNTDEHATFEADPRNGTRTRGCQCTMCRVHFGY